MKHERPRMRRVLRTRMCQDFVTMRARATCITVTFQRVCILMHFPPFLGIGFDDDEYLWSELGIFMPQDESRSPTCISRLAARRVVVGQIGADSRMGTTTSPAKKTSNPKSKGQLSNRDNGSLPSDRKGKKSVAKKKSGKSGTSPRSIAEETLEVVAETPAVSEAIGIFNMSAEEANFLNEAVAPMRTPRSEPIAAVAIENAPSTESPLVAAF